MTDRKTTCVACKSAITEGDIAGKDLEFGGELKATNQPTYASDADTDLVATIGTLDEYTPMVRTTGNQSVGGIKTYTDVIIKKDSSSPAYTSPATYVSKFNLIRITGSDDGVIVGLGYEKSPTNVSRAVLTIYSNKDTDTGNQPYCQLHFIINETDGSFKMSPAHIDKNGTRTFGTEQTLMTWSV